jgi:hypothetical protein
MRRRSVPHTAPRLCATSCHFGNRGQDCLGPCVSCSAVTNCYLGKCQMRHYGIHVMHLGAFAPIKYHHVPTGGTAPPVESRQVQISSKPRRGKRIGPTSGFTASPDVGPGAIVGTLQTGYPCAQDISLVPQRQTPHLAGKGSDIATCPRVSRSAPGAGELWHCHGPRGTGHATR